MAGMIKIGWSSYPVVVHSEVNGKSLARLVRSTHARRINSIHDNSGVKCDEEISEEVFGRMKKFMIRAGEHIFDEVAVDVGVTVSPR